MDTSSSPEKLGHDEYINALTELTQEDAARHKELFDLLKARKLDPVEFTTKTQERDHEFRQKHADIMKRSL